ncbi:hypothetical protein F4819DRAFT_442146 [Hypoxylon fuscum]|nr:hypothetical protein F4819DRAFT_442146 [Hypoxylon fuscum]
MQKRRSHKKSRNGCQNCKKWHTKCDEAGPPCNNCTLRRAQCVYNRPKDDHTNNGGSLTIRPKLGDTATCSIVLERPLGDVGSLCSAYGGPGRLLELELMHQWSTTTYKSFCGIPEDGEYLQVVLTRCSLNYDFMLNCIMAISSLHIAKSVGEANSAKYVNAALEFYNRGSSSFRQNLGSVNAENSHILYMFSAIAISVHLATPQRSPSMLNHVAVAFDLLNGSINLAMMAMPWILKSPFPLSIFISRMGASKDFIDADSRAALTRLSSLNDRHHKAVSEPIGDGEEEGNGVVGTKKHELYQTALQCLEMCFAEEARGVLRGFGTAFPAMTGKAFTSLINESDPFSLLITMHWAVLISRTDRDVWWLISLGEHLAIEISDLLNTFHPDLAREWHDAMLWPLERMDLSSSQFSSQSSSLSREISFS